MRVHRGWALVLALVLPGPFGGCGDDKPTPTEAYQYDAATVAGFGRLLATPEWGPADPPRNAQGMFEAVHSGTGLTFVLVPAGSFLMGSPEEEEGRDPSTEGPVHTVNVPAFLLCRTECTQRACRTGGAGGGWPLDLKDADQPVAMMSWPECNEWCARNGLRLPSEAEWEYACRAAGRTRWCFGDSESRLTEYALFNENSTRDPGSFDWHTHPVGEKRASRWGLFDMHGNVAEWCEDAWHSDYEDAPTDGSAWTTDGASSRVRRGGSWGSSAQSCRSASRYSSDEGVTGRDLGFRPAADLPR